jgi:hypothetical protein
MPPHRCCRFKRASSPSSSTFFAARSRLADRCFEQQLAESAVVRDRILPGSVRNGEEEAAPERLLEVELHKVLSYLTLGGGWLSGFVQEAKASHIPRYKIRKCDAAVLCPSFPYYGKISLGVIVVVTSPALPAPSSGQLMTGHHSSPAPPHSRLTQPAGRSLFALLLPE